MISSARWSRNKHVARTVRAAAGYAALIVLSACTASNDLSTPASATLAPPTQAAAPSGACTVVDVEPTPETSSLLQSGATGEPALGPADAAVTLLFYCDLQSPQCEVFNEALEQLMETHEGDLRVIQRLYPVPQAAVAGLDKSVLSAQAAIAAGNQEKFWEMREVLHANYEEWVTLSRAEFLTWVLERARGIGLETEQFSVDLESPATAAAAERAYTSATALGISSIPTVFINGQLQGRPALSYNGLDATIGLIVLGEQQFRSCPPFEIDPTRQYTATLHTEKGDIIIALDAANAPLAVNSFVFLAQQRWYDGTPFHRVIPGFVAQGGDPSGTGNGGPGYYFATELTEGARFDKPGVVGMVNSGPDTNGSQFFITFAPQPQFDGVYTVLGRVIDGMLVVESLTVRDPQTDNNPPQGDKILSVTVEIR